MTRLFVVFRADASSRMATGHVMRCLTLADLLREHDARVRFVCRRHPGHLIELLRGRGLQVSDLPAPPNSDSASGEDFASWGGVTQAEDARQTVDALSGERPDWMIVDHYGLDAEWEDTLRPHVARTLVIDDLANRRHHCEALVDQNFSDEGARRYAGLVAETCKMLVGPRFALLRPEYAAHHRTMRARDGQMRRVLIFFGGSDPHDMTGMALAALVHAGLHDVDVDVVAGANYAHGTELARNASRRPRTTLHATLPHLADLMSDADLVIGAGGVTNLERLCIAVPSLVVSIAENQRHTCQALSRSGLIRYLGHAGSVSVTDMAAALLQLSHDPSGLQTLSERCRPLVDGLGGSRIVDFLLSNSMAFPKDSHD
jgi:UDP-2,4-diacetamido-2,4,6-trideoxy-beta-L-altropyranose hydrolase